MDFSIAQLRCGLFVWLLWAAANNLQGQETITEMRESMLKETYFKQFGPRNTLSGKTYFRNYDHINGNPFFLDYYEGDGYFIYDGILYKNIPFQYDIYNQAIIVKTAGKGDMMSIIRIDAFKVSEFKVGDIKFKRYQNDDLPEGFYQMAYNGTRSMLLIGHFKEVKKLTRNIRGKLRIFVTKSRFFLVINKKTIEIRKKRDVLKAFENTEALVGHIRKLLSGPRQDKFEEKLISVLTYYEKL